MLLDLDDLTSRDPRRVGGKAAALARARAAGAAVLPGFVVAGAASRAHMTIGAETLPIRGSGGARLAVSAEPVPSAESMVVLGEELGDRLVARSSTILEARGEWSGAFTSYLDLAPTELPRAVAGCWASAFSVAALQRQSAAGIDPGSIEMSVLIQPCLTPTAGGWARVASDGTAVVRAVEGSPAPLLQGWVTGAEASFNGSWHGDELIAMLGLTNLDSIRGQLMTQATGIGADSCEWVLTDRVWLLQLSKSTPAADIPEGRPASDHELSGLIELAETLVLAPGPLGEQVVLPWAIAGLPDVEISHEVYGEKTVQEIQNLSRELTREVWQEPVERATRSARRLMDRLSAGDSHGALEALRRLHPPDPINAGKLLGKLRSLREELVSRGVAPDERAAWRFDFESIERALLGEPASLPGRTGMGRWEPLLAAVVLADGRTNNGVPASPGIGAGLRAHNGAAFRSPATTRGVITAPQPIPALAPLLWDASAMVTATGSPAAHLFEAARSLRVPAVCSLDLGEPRNEIVAVDGHTGRVATLPLDREI